MATNIFCKNYLPDIMKLGHKNPLNSDMMSAWRAKGENSKELCPKWFTWIGENYKCE